MHGPIESLAQHRNDHVEQQHHRKEDEAVGEHEPDHLIKSIAKEVDHNKGMERRAGVFCPLDHRVCRLRDARHEGRVFEQRSLEEVLEHLCRQDILCVQYVPHGDLERATDVQP